MTGPEPPAGYQPGRTWAMVTNVLSGRRTWYGRPAPQTRDGLRAGDAWRPECAPLITEGLDTCELVTIPEARRQ